MPTSSDASGFERQGSKAKQWIEPVAALLMALTTLGTAWCSYESASWTRRSNRLVNESNVLNARAHLLQLQGMQSATIHSAMFMQLLAAQQAGNERLASFYVQRFPPDVRKAYDAWVAQKPLENPEADPHPFVHNLYQLRGSNEAAEATNDAARHLQEAGKAGNVSGQYLANTVLFATVLFFANAAGKFEQSRVRSLAFAFAILVFLFAFGRTVTLPL